MVPLRVKCLKSLIQDSSTYSVSTTLHPFGALLLSKADHITGHTVLLTHLPVSSSKMRIPRDQQSAPESWPLFMMTSGATYSGVPQNVHVFFPRPILLAKPKSA